MITVFNSPLAPDYALKHLGIRSGVINGPDAGDRQQCFLGLLAGFHLGEAAADADDLFGGAEENLVGARRQGPQFAYFHTAMPLFSDPGLCLLSRGEKLRLGAALLWPERSADCL